MMSEREEPQRWGPRSPEPSGPPRSGTEPLTARTDLPLRLLLSLIFAPLFTLLTVGFAVWWLTTSRGGGAQAGEMGLLVLALGVLTVVSWIDLFVIRRRMRRVREAGGG